MKTLDIEQLLQVAGAEPRGVSDVGRQNDGTDIVSSTATWNCDERKTGGCGYFVTERFNDGSVDKVYPNQSIGRTR